MGSNTLTNRAAGQTILDTFFNDIHQAIGGDFMGRNTSGVPTSGQNLGTASIPWGTARVSGLVVNGTTVDTTQISSPLNRVISGKKRSTSNQPAFITPNGAAASFIVAGATTPLAFDVNGTSYSISTDITKSSLTVAPSSNNTTLVNDTSATGGQALTRTWGEYLAQKDLAVDAMGSGISALVGKWAAFKLAGAATEYFLAYVESTTKLSKCFRGFFYNSSLAPINRTTLTDNDVITLMSLAWVFADYNGTTIDVTYNNPVWNYTSPTSPATGDYWYDLANATWKRYDGSAWQTINRTFIGLAVIDSTNCVAARSVDFFAKYDVQNSMDLEVLSVTAIQAKYPKQRVNVAGVDLRFEQGIPNWNITTDLATSADMYNATEQASTEYFCYIRDDGKTQLSDISPYWRADFQGFYHPHNPWRCVGRSYNNASSNLTNVNSFVRCTDYKRLRAFSAKGSTNTFVLRWGTVDTDLGIDTRIDQSATLGDKFTVLREGLYFIKCALQITTAGQTMGIVKNGVSPTTGVVAQGSADTLATQYYATASTSSGPLIAVARLVPGDYVWVQTNDTSQTSGTQSFVDEFLIARIAD